MCAPRPSYDWDRISLEALGRRVAIALDAGAFAEARHYARLRTATRRRMRASQQAPHDAVTYVDA